MIQGIHTQIDSPNAHIRGWGCLFSCYGAMIQDKLNKILTAVDIAKIFQMCIANKSVKDNFIPLSIKGWWRAYCVEPEIIIDTFAEWMQCGLKGELISKSAYLTKTIEDCYTIAELETANGSHFIIAEVENAAVANVYDPWPSLKRTGKVLSFRNWRIA